MFAWLHKKRHMECMLHTQTKSEYERYLGKGFEILLNGCVVYVPHYFSAYFKCESLYTDRESGNRRGCVVYAESPGGTRV